MSKHTAKEVLLNPVFANNPIGGIGYGSNPTGFGLGLKHTF